MTKKISTDVCVIGAGSGGLSAAAAVAAFGVPVVLLEKHKMGGDCLNTGCVPSKALLAASKKAHVFRHSSAFGIKEAEPEIDFAAVNRHVHEVIGAIAPNDSVERFEGLGVEVISEAGSFVDEGTVQAGEYEIKARRFVVATGSSAAVPPIPGLDTVPFLTNESIFTLTECPKHLMIIGGGPIGMEMAQSHRRLGADVSVFEGFAPLAKDDPELVAVALKNLKADGLNILSGVKIKEVKGAAGAITVAYELDGEAKELTGSHLLVAAGRRPNLDGLNLEAAGVKYGRTGIEVDAGLRSSNRRVYAIGDVAGGLQFTHVAGAHAGIIIRSMLFRLPAKFNPEIVPWCTYTDPEIAWVGLREEAARERFGEKAKVLSWPYHENDRAQAERQTEGLVKLILGPKGRIVGGGVVGLNAGEIINILALAISSKLKVGDLVGFIAPYPTLSEVIKRAAVTHYSPAAKNVWIRRVVNFLRKFG